MQLKLLESNLEIIRERIPAVAGMSVPSIQYEPSCGCFQAEATLNDDLMKRPLEQSRLTLML